MSSFCKKISPTYENISKYLSLIIIVLLLWSVIYMLSPELGSPKGQLCNLIGVILLAYIGGIILYKLTTLPSLIGMLLMGILLQYLNLVNIDGEFSSVTSELKRMSIVVTLTRLGLGLDQPTIKKSFVGVFKLGLIPWILECVTIAILSHYFLNLPWNWSFLLSTIIAAVSPAVVVPCFKKLRKGGYVISKGVPKLILAAASIDDITSITVCCILSSIMFNPMLPLILTIFLGPLLIICAIVFGIILGFILKYVPEKNNRFVVVLRVMILLFGCYAVSLSSYLLGYPLAGSLATICTAFVVRYNWSKQGWKVEGNPVVEAYRILWIVFEPILFGLTGTQLELTELDTDVVLIGTGCILVGVVIRIIAAVGISFGNNFNMKERLFIALSWIGKATLQAALGTLALSFVMKNNSTDEEIKYAKDIVTISTLSIILFAPLGAILITISGSKFLSKSDISKDVEQNGNSTK